MSLPKYKYLLTYRYSEIIHDLTFEFCRLYIDYRSRTKDQMEQGARSGKQCLVEGVGLSQTSKKGELKLLGVSKASFDELLTDYEDFLRQHNLQIYPKTHPKVSQFRQTAYRFVQAGGYTENLFKKRLNSRMMRRPRSSMDRVGAS